MIKIMLVDDEEIIKSGLRNEVDWESAGCVICAEASDGQEALDLIQSDPPDVIISDIRMPFKDGLTLMEEVRGLYPDIFFLFISGHDEFSYVQKALKLGASDYILKPIDPQYLERKLKDIEAELGSRHKNEAAKKTGRKEEVRRFLQKIIFEKKQDEVLLREEARAIDPGLEDRSFQVLSFQIDHYYSYGGREDDAGQEHIRKTFYNLARLFPRDSCFFLTESLREYDLCLMADSAEQLKTILEEGLNKISRASDNYDYTLSIGVGDGVLHLFKLFMSFSQARKALELKFIKGENKIFTVEDYNSFSRQIQQGLTLPAPEELLAALKEGRSQDIPALLDELGRIALTSDDPRTSLNWLASDILLQMIKLLEERELSLEEVMDDPLQEWKLLGQSATAEQFIGRLQDMLLQSANYIHIRRNYHSSQILDQTLKYIKEHFTEGSFSLEDAAARACMSSCYFAVIFKQETGQTFNRYLTDLRINKAKDLILYTDMKSYEIGPKVGYENPSYFSTVFKKVTGLSPSEYRKNFS